MLQYKLAFDSLDKNTKAAGGVCNDSGLSMSKAKYRCIRGGCGYYTFVVDSYTTFVREVTPLFTCDASGHKFVWRGMRDPRWSLQSSLSRNASASIRKRDHQWQQAVSRMTTEHLLSFMTNLRGLSYLRREHDDLYSKLSKHRTANYNSFLTVLEDMEQAELHLVHELFALGQHFGLATPFLDWTSVPLVALYFAFQEAHSQSNGIGCRVVFALNESVIDELCPRHESKGPDDILLLESMAHENSRIVAQQGVFTFVPAHLPVDQWVVSRCLRDTWFTNEPILLRFLIRNDHRDDCLRELAESNIHARTVFPDFSGASTHTNYLSLRNR